MFAVALDPRAETVIRALDQLNLSRRWLSRKIGESATNVSMWLSGNSVPRDDRVWAKMQKALREESVGRQRQADDSPVAQRPQELRQVRSAMTAFIPIIGPIGAGYESHGQGEGDRSLEVPIQFAGEPGKGTSGLIVDGYSMMPFLQPGDVLVFRDSTVPRAGVVNAVTLPQDGGPVAKEIGIDQGKPVLLSYNPEFGQIDASGVVCHGFLIGVFGGGIIFGPEERGIGRAFFESELRRRTQI